ncbi:sulfotransferase [Spelaeicoccus albus]
MAAYQRHVDDVRRNCAEQRLIEWSVRDGWEPLCIRLGTAVPVVAVPHLNARMPQTRRVR